MRYDSSAPLQEAAADMPPSWGKLIILTYYVDANLMHGLATGRSTTRMLHLVNRKPQIGFASSHLLSEILSSRGRKQNSESLSLHAAYAKFIIEPLVGCGC